MPLSLTRRDRSILFTAVACAGLCALLLTGSGTADETLKQQQKETGMLRHVVLFQFKPTSTEADIRRIVEAFRGLPVRIPEIKGFEWGTDMSPEGKAEGFTHCFLVTFATAADRDAYLPHPAHKDFVSIVGPHVAKVCVVDFFAQP
ncbi:MAG: Dabb family protein [Planctomycetaceae bacterium]